MKTSELLKKYGVKLKKHLGQNFLSTQEMARKIVQLSGVGPRDIVVEIGAGAGTLTEELAKVAGKVVAYEIDRSLEKLLKDRLSSYENVELVFEDFLKTDLSHLPDDFVYVANIPYSITGRIVQKILKEDRFRMAVLMVQKEVADRITSPPGRKDFGYITALVQTFCSVEKLLHVSRSHFVPNPEVDSVVIKLVPKGVELDFDSYSSFLGRLFSKKRKTVKNNLKGMVEDPESLLKKLKINLSARPEELKVEEIIRIYEELK